jgi:hypothetical protein
MDKALYGADDYDMWIRIAELYPVMALEEPVAIWRQSLANSNQGSSDRTKEALLSKLIVEKSLLLPKAQTDAARKESITRHIKKATTDNLIWGAWESVESGNSKAARNSLLTAIKLRPAVAFELTTIKLLLRAFVS